MRIEKLEPSKHREGRWLVWFEDGSLLRVGEGDVVALSLYAGKELDEKEAAALTAAAQKGRLSERAVNMLSARPMSKKELQDKLRQREDVSPQQLEGLCGDLERWGLLNDREYAAAVARHYTARGYGIRKLRDELYRRGVPREYWEEALDGIEPPEDQLDRLVRQKLRGAEPTRENLKKVSDYLARRGFRWEEISQALDRLHNEFEE